MCGLFGNTRQAYYDKNKAYEKTQLNEELIIQYVEEMRESFPRIGTRKLHYMMETYFGESGVSIGRDALFELLARNFLLVRRKRTTAKTTDSNHRYHRYPNLIKDRTLTAPNEVWVSDITYVRHGSEFMYLFLITDAYSHKIVGWELALDLTTRHALTALKMALKGLPEGHTLTHHSDRGTQYCCNDYVELLNKNGISISMTENGDPLENAIAERVNGILKTEWINDMKFKDFNDAKERIGQVIYLYNYKRPHLSIGYLTPEVVHKTGVETKRCWKNYNRFAIPSELQNP